MTDDEVELFISLKYANMDKVLTAFRRAIDTPESYLIKHANFTDVAKGVHKWVEQGCPDKLDIAPEDTELFLCVKFGSLSNAYWWWRNTPPGSKHHLSKHELTAVLDYVPANDPPRS